jgi:uncharacterized repeat protein (TIGR03803 family)
MNNRIVWTRVCAILLACVSAAIPSSAQTVTTLVNFDGANGADPCLGALVQGTDGNFYGTTSAGGAHGHGTVFRMTPAGALTTLHSFRSTDGSHPYGGLTLAAAGDLYGTTWLGGAHDRGTVFRMTLNGAVTTLHSFDGTDGSLPTGTLVQATNGNFYGTASSGGPRRLGTVFVIAPDGTLTTLHIFDGTDGSDPWGGLVQGVDGNLYGTTAKGGGQGTIYKITLGGELTTLHRFKGADGSYPIGSLVQGADGNFYGTTAEGGANPCPPYVGCGTIFKITTEGALTPLHSFDGTDGDYPSAGLTQGNDGNFYGTTTLGSAIFKISPSGTLTLLSSSYGEGSEPLAPLAQGTDGNFYGTAPLYGLGGCSGYGCGTVFSLSAGLAPFVITLPTSGSVGTAIKILATDLTGATTVTFNGTAAAFTVAGPSEILTTVPDGATTGVVQVTTAGSTLLSNAAFTVRP